MHKYNHLLREVQKREHHTDSIPLYGGFAVAFQHVGDHYYVA